jgi:hypothetical protein
VSGEPHQIRFEKTPRHYPGAIFAKTGSAENVRCQLLQVSSRIRLRHRVS